MCTSHPFYQKILSKDSFLELERPALVEMARPLLFTFFERTNSGG